MANGIKVGTFSANTSTGNQTVSWTGTSFTPNFVVLWTQGQTSNGKSTSSGVSFSWGMTDGTNHYSVNIAYEDGAATSNASRQYSTTNLLKLSDHTGAIDGVCNHVSFGSQQFVIDWPSDAPTGAVQIHYLAMECTSVAVGTYAYSTSVTDIVVSGLGFQPNTLITLGTSQTTADSIEANAAFFMGMATGATAESCCSFWMEDAAANTNDARGVVTNATARGFLSAVPGVDMIADFQSFDVGGFTLNVTDAAASAHICGYAAIVVDNAISGTATNPTTDITEDTITGVGFLGTGAIFMGIQSSSTTGADSAFFFGAADDESTINNAAAGFYTDDAAAVSSAGTVESNTLCVSQYYHDGTLRGDGLVASYKNDSGGQVSMTWTNTSGARQFSYIVMAQAASAGGGRIMGAIAGEGGLAGLGGMSGQHGGLVG